MFCEEVYSERGWPHWKIFSNNQWIKEILGLSLESSAREKDDRISKEKGLQGIIKQQSYEGASQCGANIRRRILLKYCSPTQGAEFSSSWGTIRKGSIGNWIDS